MNIDRHFKRLKLNGKAFTNSVGLLSVEFMADVKTSTNRSTFITWCPCPQDWAKYINKNGSGRPYFFNARTGQVTGVLPPERDVEVTGRTFAVPIESDFDMNGQRLPQGWKRGDTDYFNVTTKVRQRSTPLYQGEAGTSYSIAGDWDVEAAKPHTSDFQFFETNLENYSDIGRQANDLFSAFDRNPNDSALATLGSACTIQ